jgi:hypothetical protein
MFWPARIVLQRESEIHIIVFVDMAILNAVPTLRSARFLALFCFSLLARTLSISAEISLHKVPPLTVEQAPAYPQNLARYVLGAQIQISPERPEAQLELSSMSEDTNKSAAALLCDDPTVGYALSKGTTTIVVSLPNIENVASVSFVNRGAKGEVSIATSSAQLAVDSPQWHSAAQEQLSPEAVRARIGPTDAKYVKVTFHVTEPGRIAGFGVYSTAAVSDFTMPRQRRVNLQGEPESAALIADNLSDVHDRARALYVSSGSDLKRANHMIDDQPGTVYTFAAGDTNPVAVIDLGRVCDVRRISTLYSPRKGTVDFFVLKTLPVTGKSETEQLSASALQKGASAGGTPVATKAAELPSSTGVSAEALNNLQPVATVATNGESIAAVDFAPISGRFIMVRWREAADSGTPFSVAEIAVFDGKKPAAQMLAANEATENVSYGDGKSLEEGKEVREVEAPAEGPPPDLPLQPSFSFIPQVVPTSP